MTRKQVYFDSHFWVVVFAAITLVVVFNWISMTAAIVVACVLVLLMFRGISSRPSRVLGFLLLAACYERPVLDFGLGIRGTIKLVDLVVVAILLFSVINFLTKKHVLNRPAKSSFIYLTIIVIFSICSALFVNLFGGYPSEAKIKTIYYVVILVEYTLAYYVISIIRFHEIEIYGYFKIFLLGLVGVSIVSILQGLGIIENQYYISISDVETNIEDSWAISTLGPNHSHLGSYMALGFILSVLFLHLKFSVKYMLAAPLFMMGIGFSHSTVGFAIVGLYNILILLTGDKKLRRLGFFMTMVVIIFASIYLSGSIGEDSERTAEKLTISGSESEVLVRAVTMPIEMLIEGYSEVPLALLVGFGFKVPNYTVMSMKPTGDNNYFSLAMDLGLIGLIIYILFLRSLYVRLKYSNKVATTKFTKLFSYHILTWAKLIFMAMFFQEILWPLHSRGSTMLIFLIIFELSARSMLFLDNRDGKDIIQRKTARSI